MNKLTGNIVFATVLAAAASACGSAQINQARLTDAEAALRSAEEVGAKQQPTAALHIELAEEQIARAKQLAAQGEEKEADLMLMRAQSDAELAIQLAKTQAARSDAQQTWEKVEQLRADQRHQ